MTPTEPPWGRRPEFACGLSARDRAALRFWQDEVGPHAHAGGCYPEHLDDPGPLGTREIGESCERPTAAREVPHGP